MSTIELRNSGPDTEVSTQFLQGMVDRMMVSFAKYGAIADGYPEKVDALANLARRLEMYAKTGNTEYLMDVANFAMIEFMRPHRSDAFFQATDSNGSPGRVACDGHTTRAKNAHIINT